MNLRNKLAGIALGIAIACAGTVLADTTVRNFGAGGSLPSAVDDQTIVNNGTTWQAKSLPNCTDSGGNHINYTAATNSFSCGTSSSSSGAGDVSSNTATSVDSEVALFSGTAGKTIKRATGTGLGLLTSGVLSALAVTDDSIPVGNGTTMQMKAVPACTDTGGNHLNYDTSTNAFSCGTSAGSGSGPTINAQTAMFFYDEFFGVGQDTSGSGTFNSTVTGTGAAVGVIAGAVGHPGLADLATGSTTSGDAIIMSAPVNTTVNRAIIPSSATLTFNAVIRLPTLPDGTNTYTAYIGLSDRNVMNNQRALARVFWNGSAARWGLETSDGAATTNSDASTGPSANTFYNVRLTITDTLVTLLIDGVSVATSSTNLGNAGYAPAARIVKSAGTTSRDLQIDVIQMTQTFAAARW